MRVVPVVSAPNQAFVVTIDGSRYFLRIYDFGTSMAIDLAIDGKEVLSGFRALANEPLIPYRHMQKGNFLFSTLQAALPDWRVFSVSQFLVYVSNKEADLIPPVTAGDLAAVPGSEFLISDGGFYLTTDTGDLLTNG